MPHFRSIEVKATLSDTGTLTVYIDPEERDYETAIAWALNGASVNFQFIKKKEPAHDR